MARRNPRRILALTIVHISRSLCYRLVLMIVFVEPYSERIEGGRSSGRSEPSRRLPAVAAAAARARHGMGCSSNEGGGAASSGGTSVFAPRCHAASSPHGLPTDPGVTSAHKCPVRLQMRGQQTPGLGRLTIREHCQQKALSRQITHTLFFLTNSV